MSGSAHDTGLLGRLVYDLFDSIQSTTSHEYIIRVSYMECYNEIINDLLESNSTNLQLHEREIKQTRHGKIQRIKQIYADGLKEIIVNNPVSVLELVNAGESRRKTGKTNYNERSSRSHSIFRLTVESNTKLSKQSDSTRYSILNLIDLAGSENISNVGSNLQRTSETGYINKSLLTLSTVITKLAQHSQKSNSSDTPLHLPFRDSKLTRLLQNSLSGDSLVTVIATISPAINNVDQSLNTLRFASNAKHVKQNVSINELSDDSALLKQYRAQIESLKNQLQYKEQQINTLQSSRDAIGSNDIERSALAEKIEQLESLIVTSTINRPHSGSPHNNNTQHKPIRSIPVNGTLTKNILSDISNVSSTPTNRIDSISNEQLQQLCNASKDDIIVKLLSCENENQLLRSSITQLHNDVTQYKEYYQSQHNQYLALQNKVNELIKPLLVLINKNKSRGSGMVENNDENGLLDTNEFDDNLIEVDELFQQLNTNPLIS